MARIAATSNGRQIELWADGQRNQFSGPEAHAQELDELDTALDISVGLEPLELRKKFVRLFKSNRETMRRLLDDKKKCEDDAHRYRRESAGERQALRQEITKLQEDLDAVQHQLQQQNASFQQQDANIQRQNADRRKQNANFQQQNIHLQRQIRENGIMHGKDEAPTRMPQKRQQLQSSDSECEDSDDQPRKRVRVKSGHASREQIRDVLGGCDRGWGSTQSCPGFYRCHVHLDVGAHLFGQVPSRRQNVLAEAVLGFGPDDDISEAGLFPLFVRNKSEHRTRFTYLGNYVAVRLDPVAWERLSDEGKEYAVQTVQFKGLSADPFLCKKEKVMEKRDIERQFQNDTFKVPCSRLEFQDFDEKLDADIQNSLGRIKYK